VRVDRQANQHHANAGGQRRRRQQRKACRRRPDQQQNQRRPCGGNTVNHSVNQGLGPLTLLGVERRDQHLHGVAGQGKLKDPLNKRGSDNRPERAAQIQPCGSKIPSAADAYKDGAGRNGHPNAHHPHNAPGGQQRHKERHRVGDQVVLAQKAGHLVARKALFELSRELKVDDQAGDLQQEHQSAQPQQDWRLYNAAKSLANLSAA